jgi:curli biogenesis system outer membrane secretion channel CsgG
MRYLFGVMVTLAVSTAFADDATQVVEKSYQIPKCAEPVASVVVGKMNCKAAGCQERSGKESQMETLIRMSQNGANQATFPGIGEGMSAMLTTVLKETGCFDIQEREAMDELAKELALVGKKVEVQQADFMISGSITSINMATQKSSLGGGFIPIIGMISTTTKTADIGLDIKVIDVNRAKIIDSRTFQANNKTSNTSFGAAGFGGAGLLAGGMSSYKDTPMEPILRDILAQVASFTAGKLLTVKGAATATTAGSGDVTAPATASAPTPQAKQ